MGIDAEMLVRNRGPKLDDTALRRVAANMCARLGHEKFFIARTAKYGFDAHHALDLCDTVAQVRAEYAKYGDDVSKFAQAADDAQVWTQDGPPVISEPGEQFIRVRLWSRYYGEGYERGDWPTIRAAAEFLEQAIEGAEIWYGGDSSGVCIEPFGATRRAELNRHFLTHGHDPYRGSFGSIFAGRQPPQVCDFCGGRPMHNTGGGGDMTFWSCDGCGEQRITHAGGVYTLTEEESRADFGFSNAAQKLRGATPGG